jgi:iron complex outermembrane recepter protein
MKRLNIAKPLQASLAGIFLFFGTSASLTGRLIAAEPSPESADELEALAPLEESDDVDDLLNLDIDQLASTNVDTSGSVGLDTEVSAVSRTAQPISRTGSAVFVITNEMIKRSGARNVPEALRIAPGVNVQQVSSWQWAISIRGFNSTFANKLLVQVDGRAVYTPIFSGTYWDQQFVPLKDIDRIEVVRGPGGTVWGANAVNGVINIVTKSSQETQGLYAEAGGGTEHRSFSHARGGGQAGQNLTYRAYAAQLEDDRSFLPGGSPAPDGRTAATSGFRMDWTPTRDDVVTFQGDYFWGTDGFGGSNGGTGLPVQTYDAQAGNILSRWTHQVDETSSWAVQLYYDHQDRTDPNPFTGLDINQNAFDLDTQYTTFLNEYNEIVCGFGYRQYSTFAAGQPTGLINFVPESDEFKNVSCFLQDTITLREDFLFATLGCKLEENDFVGFLYQPAVKVVMTPNDKTSLWSSVSRAVRTPSIVERDVLYILPVAPNTFLRLQGNDAIDAENVISYEIGMRRQETDRFYWDLATYFSRYEELIGSQSTGVTVVGPNIFLESMFANAISADTYGVELLATYEIAEWWRLRGYYTFFRDQFRIPPGVEGVAPGTTPRNQAYLNSSCDITERTTLDGTLRYSDSLPIGVPSYLVMDLRWGWRPKDNLEFAVVGQNMLDGSHLEGIESGAISTEVQSGVYGMMSWGY